MLAIIDYGLGNVRSVLNAFAYLGVSAMLTNSTEVIERASGLVLPGVGAFGEGMRRIDSVGLRPVLADAARLNKPMLGICLGFQMFMRSSTEQSFHQGLGFAPFEVVRLPVEARLPHIGWTAISTSPLSAGPSRLMRGLEDESFYFVHSYAVVRREGSVKFARAVYAGCEFIALIEQSNLFGTQFHPEKSGEAGLELLRNFALLAA